MCWECKHRSIKIIMKHWKSQTCPIFLSCFSQICGLSYRQTLADFQKVPARSGRWWKWSASGTVFFFPNVTCWPWFGGGFFKQIHCWTLSASNKNDIFPEIYRECWKRQPAGPFYDPMQDGRLTSHIFVLRPWNWEIGLWAMSSCTNLPPYPK